MKTLTVALALGLATGIASAEMASCITDAGSEAYATGSDSSDAVTLVLAARTEMADGISSFEARSYGRSFSEVASVNRTPRDPSGFIILIK